MDKKEAGGKQTVTDHDFFEEGVKSAKREIAGKLPTEDELNKIRNEIRSCILIDDVPMMSATHKAFDLFDGLIKLRKELEGSK